MIIPKYSLVQIYLPDTILMISQSTFVGFFEDTLSKRAQDVRSIDISLDKKALTLLMSVEP